MSYCKRDRLDFEYFFSNFTNNCFEWVIIIIKDKKKYFSISDIHDEIDKQDRKIAKQDREIDKQDRKIDKQDRKKDKQCSSEKLFQNLWN